MLVLRAAIFAPIPMLSVTIAPASSALPLSSTGYMTLCLMIEYAKTFPKLRGILSPDPHVPIARVATQQGSSYLSADRSSGHCDSSIEPLAAAESMNLLAEDADVAAEAARVDGMFNSARVEDGAEVVLKGLRKVYRTKQVT